MTALRTLGSLVLLFAFTSVSVSPAGAKPDNKPPAQAPVPDEEPGPPQPAYGPPPAAYPPPPPAAQAPPAAGVKGFSQRQKECRIQVRCPQDPTKPCPPCAGL